MTNLRPRQIRGMESQSMALAADLDGGVAPLAPARDVAAGAGIK
jgi:tRNA-binding EMAP/Myf-like protein